MAMRPAPLLLSMLALAGAPAAAQDAPPSLNDFRLAPAPQPRVDPRLQGPALRPAPVPLPTEQPPATPRSQRPSPDPQAAPTSPAPPTAVESAPRPAARTRSTSALPARTPAREPVRPNPVASAPSASAPASTPPGGDVAVEAPAQPPVVPGGSAEPLPDGERSVWPLVLLGLAGLTAACALAVAVLRRRRSGRPPAPAQQPAAASPVPPLAPALTPRAKPIAVPRPVDAPADEGVADGPLRVLFEPVEAHATPFGTTLKARITVTNTGEEPVTDAVLRLAIAGAGPEGDAKLAAMLAGADGSVSDPLADLAPGERRTLDRSLRVGAREFRPIQLADRTIFVPQVAFDLTGRADGVPVRLSGACLVGRRPSRPEGKMGPFRLDLGPRHYRDLMQRPHDPGSATALARAS